MVDVVIREAVRDDCPKILELIKELAAYEKMIDKVTITIEQFQKDFDHNPPLFTCFVVEKTGEPGNLIGYALTHFDYSTFNGKRLYLEDIFVSEKYRNQAVGNKLFSYLCKIAAERDVKVMSFVVLDWNPARNFYKKLGAICDDFWKWHHLGEDGIKKAAALY